MNTPLNSSKKQAGAATLFTSVILLIAITLVTFLTAKTILQETKMTANNYRAAQAITEADAAMDYAIAYFNEGGLDHNNDNNVDIIGTPPGTSTITFDNTDTIGNSCKATPHEVNMKSAEITVTGTSDDGVASRTISQCVGTINIFSDTGPQQPLIARGTVGLTGNFKVINRVNNTTVWTGGDANIGNSSSASTYIWDHSAIRPDATDISNRAIFEDIAGNPPSNTNIVSTQDVGLGVDIVDNDLTLANLTGDQLFEGFFPSGRDFIKGLAEGIDQALDIADGDALSDLNSKDGVMWIDGDPASANPYTVNLTGGTFGSPGNPVALIVNGNLNVSGNPVIYGVLYITGQLDATGTVNVIGSTIVEGDSTMVPAGEDPIVGSGGVDLTYSPFTQGLSPNGIAGTAAVIAGSWRDW